VGAEHISCVSHFPKFPSIYFLCGINNLLSAKNVTKYWLVYNTGASACISTNEIKVYKNPTAIVSEKTPL